MPRIRLRPISQSDILVLVPIEGLFGLLPLFIAIPLQEDRKGCEISRRVEARIRVCLG